MHVSDAPPRQPSPMGMPGIDEMRRRLGSISRGTLDDHSPFENALHEADQDDDPEKMVEIANDAFVKVNLIAGDGDEHGEAGSAKSAGRSTHGTKFFVGPCLRSSMLDGEPDFEFGKVTVNSVPSTWLKEVTQWQKLMGRLEQTRLGGGYLFVSKEPELCSARVVYLLATTRHRSVLGSLGAQAILNEAFLAAFPYYLLDIACHFMRLIALMQVGSYLVWRAQKCEEGFSKFELVSISLVYLITIHDFIFHGCKAKVIGLSTYLWKDYWQLLVDGIRMYNLVAYLIYATNRPSSCIDRGHVIFNLAPAISFHQTLLGLIGNWTALEWIMCVWSLRGLRLLGPKLLPVLSATTGAGGFWIVLFFVMAAAVNYYYIVAPAPFSSGFAKSYMLVHRFVFFAIPPFEEAWDHETSPRHSDDSAQGEQVDILIDNTNRALVVGSLMAVILMNIFIGILSKNFERAESNAESLFLRQRALITLECISIPWYKRGLGFPLQGHILVLLPCRSAAKEQLLQTDAITSSAMLGVHALSTKPFGAQCSDRFRLHEFHPTMSSGHQELALHGFEKQLTATNAKVGTLEEHLRQLTLMVADIQSKVSVLSEARKEPPENETLGSRLPSPAKSKKLKLVRQRSSQERGDPPETFPTSPAAAQSASASLLGHASLLE